MPWAGPYWGIWLAVQWKFLVSNTDRAVATRLRKAGERELVLSGWAVDWVAATIFLFSKSAWAAAFGRSVCRVVVRAVLSEKAHALPRNRNTVGFSE